MKLDEINNNHIYECRIGAKIAPVRIVGKLPTGIVGINLNSKREVFIKQTSKVIKHIPSLSEWRLHNGE